VNLSKKTFETPLGEFTIVANQEAIVALLLPNQKKDKQAFQGLAENKNHPILKQCEQELKEYFAGSRQEFTVPIAGVGTEFQTRVWNELMKIPFGQTTSYLKQARKLKKENAVRAVAGANSKNPIPILVPCHRVIASDGRLHGYAGGVELKKKLLEIEGLKFINQRIVSS
jgi:methylated-DNA-[protein]-cysteine S-methyltransferase